MKSISLCLIGAIVIAFFASGGSAPADEPAAAKHINRLIGLTDSDAANLTNTQLAVDFSNSLVDGNGLGIDVIAPDATLRAQLGLDETSGLVVTAAPEESRGAKAGLKVHDVIVQLNDQRVGETQKLRELLEAADGKPIKLRVLRQGKSLELEATPKSPTVARLAANRLWKHYLGTSVTEEHYRIGVTLSGTDQALRSQLRLAEGEGLVVTDVVDGGPAASAGVQKHDVLIVLDGKRLTTVEAINSQIQEIKDRAVELRLLRGGQELTLQIAPRKTQEPASGDHFLTVWDTQNCQRCHQSGVDTAHLLMGTRLRAAHSAWIDSHTQTVTLHGVLAELAAGQDAATPPQQQIDALKSQLAEMQKTLSALEAAIKPAESKPQEKREEKKD